MSAQMLRWVEQHAELKREQIRVIQRIYALEKKMFGERRFVVVTSGDESVSFTQDENDPRRLSFKTRAIDPLTTEITVEPV